MEELKHECGVAMIRLLKSPEYYKQKYGTIRYGLNKLYLLMEKQHNRGQEGAGVACVNLNAPNGTEYMFRERAEGKDAITEIFKKIATQASTTQANSMGESWEGAQLYMGHLRYSTTGKSGLQYVHPFLRRNNWRAKNLCLCGNFNMTNIDEVFQFLVSQGQSPRIYGDSYITLELMGHRLDREVERLFQEATKLGLHNTDITRYIDDNVEMANVLKTTMCHFDGGYVMCGLTGSGEFFAIRDPWGIRPAYYYHDKEIIVVASERPVIQTTFGLNAEDINEIGAGQALIVHRNGDFTIKTLIPDDASPATEKGSNVNGNIKEQYRFSACSFERIYFSRGSDCDIYKERKRLGEQLTYPILKAIDYDVANTVFSYIPNTAEVAFHGMTDGIRRFQKDIQLRRKSDKTMSNSLPPAAADFRPWRKSDKTLSNSLPPAAADIRIETVVWKDIKLRTFIAEGVERNDLAAHVYDITYGSLRPYEDQLVIIDDSIVRGTTLRESIFKILERLHPKKIVMVSSSPQIRYPDYYGIDMSRLEELCAFRAAIQLIKERGMQQLITDIYKQCKSSLSHDLPNQEKKTSRGGESDKTLSNSLSPQTTNFVRAIYAPFSVEEINMKMVEMLRPEGMETPVEMVFQSIEGLHEACPNHPGDWYFTGHYPTPGGIRMVNQAFINYVESAMQL